MKGTDWAGRWGGCPVWRTWCPCPAWWGRCPTRPACSSHSPGGWSHLLPAIRGKGSWTIGWSDLPLVCDPSATNQIHSFSKKCKVWPPAQPSFHFEQIKRAQFFFFCKNFPFSSRTITKRKLETKNAKIFLYTSKIFTGKVQKFRESLYFSFKALKKTYPLVQDYYKQCFNESFLCADFTAGKQSTFSNALRQVKRQNLKVNLWKWAVKHSMANFHFF